MSADPIRERLLDAPCPLCGHAVRKHDPDAHACMAPHGVGTEPCGCARGWNIEEHLRDARTEIVRLRGEVTRLRALLGVP